MNQDTARRRGLMLVLSSPSGAGKTTISRRLLEADANLGMSVSVTTRPPRPGECAGTDYVFVDRPAFDGMVARGDLLEHALVFGHHYGTPRAPIEAALAAGRDMMFDIDWQGTRQLAKTMRADMVTVFILPPSTAELEHRLRSRRQDSEETVHRRMAQAHGEISHWDEYDYVIVNQDVGTSLAGVLAILAAERLKRTRQEGLIALVADLLRLDPPPR
ncbi:MAG: guanylate kinase [Alphaproteobacteria bacterium]|nr:guanylate kinase [Alphaproteobacteria bacterium]